MQNLKYDANELIYKTETQTQRLTDTENRLAVATEEGLTGSLGLIDVESNLMVTWSKEGGDKLED